VWHTISKEEVANKLRTNIEYGLSEKEVSLRLQSCGKNELEEKKRESLLIRFFKQFNDFMIIILIIAAVISAVTSLIEKSNEYIDSIIIFAIVVVNAILGLVQESRAEKALDALKKMSAPHAKVKRDGKIQVILGNEVVPGDVVMLEAGNFVPADIRLIETFSLKAEESALTGETTSILKDAKVLLDENIMTGDMVNTCFGTTVITNGHAIGIVTETGMDTKVGKIAKMLLSNEEPRTPLQLRLEQIGKKLGLSALAICVLIFFIGIMKQIPLKEMFMTSVGLAVAAIPEGLPAIVTIVLSIGVTKMAKKNAIIRKLTAVETLGSSSVICSDKTGTLTQNKMKVVEIKTKDKDSKFILELGMMCTDVDNDLRGDSTEIAIVQEGILKGISKIDLYEKKPRVDEIPFDSDRKLMTTIHKLNKGYRVITKGAVDVLIGRCKNYYDNGKVISLSKEMINEIEISNNKMAESAQRVIAVAFKDVDNSSYKKEEDLIFVGLIGMIDPPRENVKEAIETCKLAGIKTVMITGDHVITATAIAKELGILTKRSLAMTGAELDRKSDNELEKEISNYSVFARVSPEHKVRIVKAFKSNGHIVAMTGDGVNDAPALKAADIGVAMGLNGTDVAKNAGDMILTDDNFITIVEAVKTRKKYI